MPRLLVRTLASASLVLGLASVTGPAPATAATGKNGIRHQHVTATAVETPVRVKALRAAASRRGSAYVYGGTGPTRFDCSGLTRWAYARAGKSLPRTSSAQAGAVRRVSRAAAKPGDLVFFTSGGRVYHVGIYAGRNQLWHASRPGVPVGKAAIWTRSVFFGKVR